MHQIRTQSRAQVSLKKKVAEGHLPKLPGKSQISREAPDDKTCIRLEHKAESTCSNTYIYIYIYIWQWLIRIVLSFHKKYARGKNEEISVKKPITVFCDWILGCFFDQGSYGSVFDMMLVTVVLCKFILSFFDFCKLLFNSCRVAIFFISGIQ